MAETDAALAETDFVISSTGINAAVILLTNSS